MALTGDAGSYMRMLQRAIGVPADGVPGLQTLAACPTLQEGRSGDAVMSLQFFMYVSPDGIFGPDTKKAVKHVQLLNDLVQDGIVGHNTWRAILKPMAASHGITL